MKNVKLALATTLSVLALALTFAGTASADNGFNYEIRYNKHKQQNVIVNSKTMKNVNRHVTRNANNNKKVVKRVVVRNTPTRKVVTTKRFVQKPAKPRFVANSRYNQVRHNNKRAYNKHRHNRYNRYNVRTLPNKFVYSVRSGGTTFQISF